MLQIGSLRGGMQLNVIVNKKSALFIAIFCIHVSFIVVIELAIRYFNIDCVQSDRLTAYLESPLELLFVVTVLAPIVEEIAFRYALVKSNYSNLGLLFGVVFAFVANFNSYLLVLMILLNVLAFIVFRFLNKKILPKIFLVGYVLVFGFSHSSNYTVTSLQELPLYAFVIQFLPQMILGTVLTYVRLSSKIFLNVIVYHALYNLVFVGLALMQL